MSWCVSQGVPRGGGRPDVLHVGGEHAELVVFGAGRNRRFLTGSGGGSDVPDCVSLDEVCHVCLLRR